MQRATTETEAEGTMQFLPLQGMGCPRKEETGSSFPGEETLGWSLKTRKRSQRPKAAQRVPGTAESIQAGARSPLQQEPREGFSNETKGKRTGLEQVPWLLRRAPGADQGKTASPPSR